MLYCGTRKKITSQVDDNMVQDTFLTALQEEARTFTEAIATEKATGLSKGLLISFNVSIPSQ